MIHETAVLFALLVGGKSVGSVNLKTPKGITPHAPQPPQKKQSTSPTRSASAGAARGAVRGGVKGAKRGAKAGGAVGKGVGGAVGGAVGSVIPGAGTAAGARVGSAIGGGLGKGIGGATGAAAGAAGGAANGARQGAANARMQRQALQQQQQGAMQSVNTTLHAINNLRKLATTPQQFALEQANKNKWKIILTVAALIFFIFVFIFGGTGDTLQNNNQSDAQVSINCVPAEVKVGQNSTCTITVTYAGSATNITTVANIYYHAKYISNSVQGSQNKGTYDPTSQTVTWDAQQLNLPLDDPVSLTFTLVVQKTVDLNAVPIVVQQPVVEGGTAGSGGTAGGAGGGVPANTNTCSGKYTADISKNYLLKANFGDPNCDMPSSNAFATYLKQQDPTNGAKWFLVSQCESGYDPDVWRDPNTVPHTPDAAGAWGLFQIGSSAVMTPDSLYTSHRTATVTNANIKQKPGLPMPTWGHGGQYDRGDTDWKTQVQDAIQLQKARGWGYWGCA